MLWSTSTKGTEIRRENVAHLKAQNALLPLYRKELRKVLLRLVFTSDGVGVAVGVIRELMT